MGPESPGALQNHNLQVNLVDPSVGAGAPISTAQYELVIVLSSFRGLWRPIIPIAIDTLLKRCTRLEGKKDRCYTPKLNPESARFLMHLMEVQGMMVETLPPCAHQKNFLSWQSASPGLEADRIKWLMHQASAIIILFYLLPAVCRRQLPFML